MLPDISQPRLVALHEVALLFLYTPRTVKKMVENGTFPVAPRTGRQGSPLLWSSVDLLRYFNEPRATSRGAKKMVKA